MATLLAVASPETAAQICADADRDGFFATPECHPTDCNDQDLRVRPDALETCNGIDDDCDGLIDDGCDSLCTSPEPRSGDVAVEGSDGMDQFQPSAVRVQNGYAVTWNQPVSGGIECLGEIRVVRIDEEGRLRFGPTILRAPGSLGRARRDSYVGWSGTHFLLAWSDAAVADCTTPAYERPYIQRLDQHLRFVGPPVDVGCNSTGGGTPRGVLWTGRQWIVVWAQGNSIPSNGLYMARIAPNGEILDPCGIRVDPEPHTYVATATNGSELVLAWVDSAPEGPEWNGEVFVRRYDMDLSPIDPAPVRVTTDTTPSREVTVTWAEGEWGLAWAQDFVDGYHEIAFARLSASGAVVVPPGIVQVTTGANQPGGFDKAVPQVRWSGREYGVFYVAQSSKTRASGDIWLARVDRDGTHLTPDAPLTPEQSRNALFNAPLWNGLDWTVLWQDASPTRSFTHFGRMGCRCSDADMDGFSSCGEGDCDDTRPNVNLARPETCGNGLDDDCDGSVDCEDVEGCPAAGTLPGTVAGLTALADKATWTFVPAPGADRHDVARGTLIDLSFEADVRRAVCLESDVAGTSFSDGDLPVRGDGYHYLVRGQSGAPSDCRLGSWGSTDQDGVLEACP